MRKPSRRAAANGAGAPGVAGGGRLAPAGVMRAVQQQVLRSFATAGRPPAAPALAETAARYGTTADAVLARLHTTDILRLGPHGEIRAAYPFSGVPTRHVVDIDGGPRVHAMCAIDALGIAAMLGSRVVITSADPGTGGPVAVTVQADGKTAAWQPRTAVVFSGQRFPAGPDDAGPGSPAMPAAAEVCCGYMNFFVSDASAAAWAGTHPEVTGSVLDQIAALHEGRAIFGPLLAGGR